MPEIIPVSNDGNREIMVTLDGVDYRFRTYYSQGQHDGWYMDIKTGNGEPILLGRRITTGAANIIKGHGDLFKGRQLTVVVLHGHETNAKNLGDGVYLLWFGEGEANPYVVGDPMIDIPADEWTFRSTSGFFFGQDAAKDIYIRNRIRAGIRDALLFLSDEGDVTIKDLIAPYAENNYVSEESGDIVLRNEALHDYEQ